MRREREERGEYRKKHSSSKSRGLIIQEHVNLLKFPLRSLNDSQIVLELNLCTYAAVYGESYRILLSVKSERDCNASGEVCPHMESGATSNSICIHLRIIYTRTAVQEGDRQPIT